MEITTSELRTAVNRILDHIDELDTGAMNIDDDLYWSIDRADRYNPYNRPTPSALGSLVDDLKAVKQIAASGDDVVAYGLVWLASVFLYIGESGPPYRGRARDGE